MAPASKKTKETNSPTMAKNNTRRLSKTITRSSSKEIVAKKQSVGAKPVKGNTKAGSQSRDIDNLGGKLVKPKASTPKTKSLASGTSTVFKRPKTDPVRKEIKKEKCTQCALKNEKLKHMEQSVKKIRTRNSSLKNQLLVLEEWKQSVVNQNTIPLTCASKINRENRLKADLKMIKAEMIRRKILQNNDKKFESLVESEEEKIKKQKLQEVLSKKMKEKQLLQEQIIARNMDIESLNQRSLHNLKGCSYDIDILRTNIKELNTHIIDTEYTLSEKIEEVQKKSVEISHPLQELEEAFAKAKDENHLVVKEYKRLLCLNEDNPPPPCEICVKREEDCKFWKEQSQESERNLRKSENKFKKVCEAEWEAAKLKEGLEAEIEFLKLKIHGTKCINVGNSTMERIGAGIINHAKKEYEDELEYLNFRHSAKYEG